MGNESAIVKRDSVSLARLEARDRFEVAMGEAKVIFVSRMFPQYQSPEQVFVVGMWAKENDVPEIEALRQIHFVNGRMGVPADLLKGMIKRHGQAQFEYQQGDGFCTLAARRLDTGENFGTTWDTARSAKAGLMGKDTYKKHLPEMLRHRCDAEACRALWPDVVGGLYIHEELEEITDSQIVGQPKVGAALAAEALGIEEPEGGGSLGAADMPEEKEPVADAAPDVLEKPAEAPAVSKKGTSVPVLGAVTLIPNGPVMKDTPLFALCATVGPVPIGRNQTDELVYLCGECGEINTCEGATCEHIEAMKGA